MFHTEIGTDGELKLLHERNAEALFELVARNRDHLRPWMNWVDRTKTVDDTKAFIKASLERFSENDGFDAGIFYKGNLVGTIGIHSIDWTNKKTSMGYWLDEEHQGKGLVSNACRAMLDHVFNDLELNRMVLKCATANKRSRAVAERLRFEHEGTSRQAEWIYDHFVDLEVYAMLRAQWPAIPENSRG